MFLWGCPIFLLSHVSTLIFVHLVEQPLFPILWSRFHREDIFLQVCPRVLALVLGGLSSVVFIQFLHIL